MGNLALIEFKSKTQLLREGWKSDYTANGGAVYRKGKQNVERMRVGRMLRGRLLKKGVRLLHQTGPLQSKRAVKVAHKLVGQSKAAGYRMSVFANGQLRSDYGNYRFSASDVARVYRRMVRAQKSRSGLSVDAREVRFSQSSYAGLISYQGADIDIGCSRISFKQVQALYKLTKKVGK